MTRAEKALSFGRRYPYDAGADFWEDRTNTPPAATDWAHAAARGVLEDLLDRQGIKHGFGGIDHDVRAEIVRSLADIIRTAAKAIV